MKPIKLFIENFMCYERSEIDFTSFNSAVIIGKVDGNDLRSNGVGKTTIFKAIEYVLFNYSSANLEKVIREDSTGCRIIFDFAIENKVYRIIRSRNKKSSISDLSLYERNSVESINAHVWDTDSSLWENKTGRRSQDTEKDIYNLIKLNYKSFISTVHFAQNDMSGLTTSTPEKRKQILKEALQLSIYSKLEKLSKDKYNLLVKDYDKNKAIIESLGNCEDDISAIENNLTLLNKDIDLNNENLLNNKKQLDECIFEFNKINSELSSFKSKKDSVNQTINSLQSIIDNLNNSIESLSAKKNKVASQSKEIVSELKKLKIQKQDLHIDKNISIEELKKDLDSNNKNLINSTILLNQNVEKINILNKQLNFFEKNNSSGECKHCKQELTKEHKDKCINDINLEIKELNNNNIEINKQISSLKEDIVNIQKNISLQEKNNKILSEINFKIKSYEEKYIENKSLYEEYNKNINSSKKSLEDNSIILNENKEKLKEFESSKKIEDLLNSINTEKQKLEKEQLNYSNINLNLNNKKSVQEHSLVQRKKDLEKIKSLINENENLSKKITIYPSVIQAFGSSGIPALIIQNMLDDLQVETNNLLNQLKPGLQLSFSIEKTKTDGTQDETLDIEYFLNGKSRDYEQLSGAMKIIVTFSLKLGLSFLLQKITGANIKMLLLDEIDQPLDKAGVDALYDIIKFFQKDFTILVITHNDRMKQKFNSGILVEQDINGTSIAKVVESW